MSRRKPSQVSNSDGKIPLTEKNYDDLGPKIDSESVLRQFPDDASAVSVLVREFASRIMMLFEMGAESGASFSEYWSTMVELRGGDQKPFLRGFGPLFHFVYQQTRINQQAAVGKPESDTTTADVHRSKLADQVQSMLSKLQRSIDSLTHGAESLASADVRSTTMESVVNGLQTISDDQLRALDMSDEVLNATLARARQAVESISRTKGGLERGQASMARASNVALASEKPPNTARIPRPPLPAIGGPKPLKSNQLIMELPLRPYVSPFQIPAQFDIAQFQAALTPRPVATHSPRAVPNDGKPGALPKMSRDDEELMKRIRLLRDEVLTGNSAI